MSSLLLLTASGAGGAVPGAFASGEAAGHAPNLTAISIFGLFVLFTVGVTYWVGRRSQSREDFYVAGGGIPAWRNGLALSGDFLSAATLLGMTSGIFTFGADGLLLIGATLAGWLFVLLLITERLRNLGRFTFIDVLSYRLSEAAIRPLAGFASLFVLLFYLIAQLVGAGKLFELLFGLDYFVAIVCVSALMVFYVVFGGMRAATWVQVIKAALLVSGGTVLAGLLIVHFEFDLAGIFESAIAAHPQGRAVVEVGGWVSDPISVFSVGLSLVFGFIGLPHITMRLFTVKDAAASRRSAFYAASIIGYFQLLIILIGFGAVPLIAGNPHYHDAAGRLIGGGNMVVLHVADFLGGSLLLGFLAAVTFATVLAVVAGLTISAAATVAHDLYAGRSAGRGVSEKREMIVSRVAVVATGVIGIAGGLVFANQNVVLISNVAMAIAASANAPVLLAAISWRGLTTRGAVAGILVGLGTSVAFVLLGPQVMIDVMGRESAIFPYAYPTVVSLPLTFLAIWLVSKTDRSARAVSERAAFDEQLVMSETGIRTPRGAG